MIRDFSDSSLVTMPLYSALPYNQKMQVFRKVEKGCRKIIAAINIAETSVTLERIKYVVDSYFVKMPF
jgi:HrpA-like RNA helicase